MDFWDIVELQSLILEKLSYFFWREAVIAFAAAAFGATVGAVIGGWINLKLQKKYRRRQSLVEALRIANRLDKSINTELLIWRAKDSFSTLTELKREFDAITGDDSEHRFLLLMVRNEFSEMAKLADTTFDDWKQIFIGFQEFLSRPGSAVGGNYLIQSETALYKAITRYSDSYGQLFQAILDETQPGGSTRR